jgi:diacylglycerol kinase (ATP)
VTATSQLETAKAPARQALLPDVNARFIILSANPRAGSRARHDAVAAIKTALTHSGYDVRLTTDLAELRTLAASFADSGDLRTVVALGGDGTAATVRNHVPLGVPILPVPMGTENLLGRYLGQLPTPQAVIATINEGVTVCLDLGRAGEKFFLLMFSAGFDAEVVRLLHENRRGNIRRWSYLIHFTRAVLRYHYSPVRLVIQTDAGPSPPHLCKWVFGFNFPLYALGLQVAPDAVPTDGELDVCSFERGSLASLARYFWYVVRNAHGRLPDAALCRTRRFRLEPTNTASIAYQLDGDYCGSLPVDVEVLPGQLRLLVSRETATRLGFALPEPVAS